jgi:dTDP-4-amino-4,6-dideoxygalactose transaminase
VPFWDSHTYRALLGAVLSGRIISGPQIGQLTERLRRHFDRPVLVCGSGRAAMTLALAAAGIGRGDEVIVPTFCCESVLHPIFAVGARPVFADAGPALMLTADTVDIALSPRTRAVIVPHMFGNPAPIDAIADLIRSRGVLLLDDAAQAFGAELQGRPLGTFGDAGIVSFGNGKICFGTGGGALLTADQDLMARARAISLQRPRTIDAIRHATEVVVWRRWRRYTLALLTRLSGRGFIRRHQPSPWGGTRNLDAAVALTLLDTLEANVAQRRARVNLYGQRLAGAEGITVFGHASGSACLTQVVHVSRGRPSLNPGRVIALLRAHGVESAFSFTPLHLQARYRHLSDRPLPRADALMESLIELPAEPQIPLDEIERIAGLVHAAAA